MTVYRGPCIWCGQLLPNRVIAELADVSPSSVDRYYRRESIDPAIRARIERTVAILTDEIPLTRRRTATSPDPVRGAAIADAPARLDVSGRIAEGR